MTLSLGPVQGTLELIVLKTLGAGSELHGFAILEWIRQSTDDILAVEDLRPFLWPLVFQVIIERQINRET